MKSLHIIFAFILASTALLASVPQRESDTFFNGDFEKIVHFNALHVAQENQLDENSSAILKKIVHTIKALQESEKDFKVSVIGHIYNAKNYYLEKMNTRLDYQETPKSLNDRSAHLAKMVAKRLTDNNITKSKIYLFAKEGSIPAYSDETAESGALSNRVMVTLYVLKPEDIDSDRDGVFDRYDRCVGTPRGSKVDKNGCPIDSDHDGVLDYKDKCPGTPPNGVMVDEQGCPLDSDTDGVVDYKDKCENTPAGISVDPQGCPIKQTLKLNFKRNSNKILADSYPVVEKFAEFLKKNPGYKVEITGHTDSIGKAVINMQLSIRRAKTVKKALVKEGVDASRIVTKGRGELDPIESNRTKEGRRANRRIEVRLFH